MGKLSAHVWNCYQRLSYKRFIPFLNQKGREGEPQTVHMHGKAKPTK